VARLLVLQDEGGKSPLSRVPNMVSLVDLPKKSQDKLKEKKKAREKEKRKKTEKENAKEKR
jgi:hypothetical protein